MLVCKIGGSEGIDLDHVADDVAALIAEGQRMVIVHGGSHRTNEVAAALGVEQRFITSPSGYTSRHTDRATLEVFEMVYCGSTNKAFVERLQARGVNAIGLSGIDGGLWRGPRKDAIRAVENGKVRIVRDSLTGTVERVNTDLLNLLMEHGMVPVLTPPAISDDGQAINVDGDRASAKTAAALGADTLLLLSNVPGLLRSIDDEASLVKEIRRAGLEDAKRYAKGRMRIKLLGAEEALDGGVERVVLGDARSERPLRRALEGQGTVIRA
jgi:acetylglutamate/LysW-gamma-L-alpha-aminoadipate kinase